PSGASLRAAGLSWSDAFWLTAVSSVCSMVSGTGNADRQRCRPGDCTGSEATSRKGCFASPQCDRAHLCAGDHASESQDLLDPCRDLERRPSRTAGGTFAATYRIDFQHAGLVATNARCAKRQASIGTPSTTKDNRGARSTRGLAASNPSEPMAETSSRRRSD